ncbi:hypothetical protein SAMN02745220_04048 [Desulfopila aestuarii DSM 18488]|uniref:Uncharacterized protein n=1 Tax=Desulfopila aestuarii DSM 18488 TaxID=1121416 RepID=A0A1M7YG35_9BACT|nr:hypothetical protein SAMN02745220_04048 [Desulfopila aestuarii DSM 18488]
MNGLKANLRNNQAEVSRLSYYLFKGGKINDQHLTCAEKRAAKKGR